MSPEHLCPRCGKPVAFASAFKKFGQHVVVACLECKTVFHNGEPQGVIEVHQ